jgi:hypothetical protein
MYNEKEYKSRWYSENKEKISKRSKEYYVENKDKIKERVKQKRLNETEEERQKRLAFHRKYNKENSDKAKAYRDNDEYRFKQYVSSANRRKLEISLTLDEFVGIINQKCIYCGDEKARGIDRVDNKVGYTIENSVPCCEMCNKMKWRWTEEQFKGQVEKIYNNLFNK